MEIEITKIFLEGVLCTSFWQNLCEEWSHQEDPERHHAKGGHGGDEGHRDGEVDVPVEQQRPEVGPRSSGAGAEYKKAQPEHKSLVSIGETATLQSAQ